MTPPFGHQNRPNTAPETSQNPRRFSKAKKMLFKSVLEPSWADLGSFWAPSWGQKNHFRIGKRSTGAKSTFLTKIGFRNASWSELGPSWAPRWPKMTPKREPRRPQIGQKSMSKNDPKFDQKKGCPERGFWAGLADCAGLLGGKEGGYIDPLFCICRRKRQKKTKKQSLGIMLCASECQSNTPCSPRRGGRRIETLRAFRRAG